MHRISVTQIAIGAIVLLFAGASASAGTLLVSEGAQLHTGNGEIAMDCGDLELAGQLSGRLTNLASVSVAETAVFESGLLSFSGDWTGHDAQEFGGTVRWLDGCGFTESHMMGHNTFSRLEITSASGRTVRFQTGARQMVNHFLLLHGVNGNPLVVRSTAAGVQASLVLAQQGGQSIQAVDVGDINSSDGQGLSPFQPFSTNSIDAGNNMNWFQSARMAAAIPSMSVFGTLVLTLLLALVGLNSLRARLISVTSNSN